METKIQRRLIMGVSLFLIVLAIIFFNKNTQLMYFIIIIIVILTVLPFVLATTIESARQKEKDSKFLDFARDLVENVRAGTPISKAIVNMKVREYGALTPHVQKLSNQISLGIPLSKALDTFAADTRSKVITRAISLISEAERSGGEIDNILNSVANSVNQTEELRKQQKSSVYNLIVQGYIIFFVFIIIVLVLQYYLLPLTQGIGNTNDLNEDISLNTDVDLKNPLLALLLVQSFFAGIVIGKISEGNFKDGIKHSFILLTLTLIMSFGADLIFGKT